MNNPNSFERVDNRPFMEKYPFIKPLLFSLVVAIVFLGLIIIIGSLGSNATFQV